MATQLPCVISPLAAKPLKNAEYQKDILVCETPEEYVTAISRLLTDQEYYRQISRNAHSFVKEHYSWESMLPLI
jgi:glycosyltransferase involved in cell wall biosynthesis